MSTNPGSLRRRPRRDSALMLLLQRKRTAHNICYASYTACYVYDLQDALDKLMQFLRQLSDCVPLKNGFYSFRAQTDKHHPVDPGKSYMCCSSKGSCRPVSFMRTHTQQYARSEYHTQLANMSFDKSSTSQLESVFSFFIKSSLSQLERIFIYIIYVQDDRCLGFTEKRNMLVI